MPGRSESFPSDRFDYDRYINSFLQITAMHFEVITNRMRYAAIARKTWSSEFAHESEEV